MKIKKKTIRGSILIETIIATALFTMLSGVVISALIYTRENQYNSYLYNQWAQLAKEGMEAVFSIKGVGSDSGTWQTQNNFDTFVQGTHYLTQDKNNNWGLTTVTPEVINSIFYRTVIIENVMRESGGIWNIDLTGTESGENALPSGEVTKKIKVHVEWKNLYDRTSEVELTTYLINWGNPLIFAN